MAGQTERLTRDFFGNTGDLEHDTAGLDNCYPCLLYTSAYKGEIPGVRKASF